MYTENNIILQRFNGNEIYEYSKGEYMYSIEDKNHVHNIIIYATNPVQLLDDSVCDSCGGVQIDINIDSPKERFNTVKNLSRPAFLTRQAFPIDAARSCTNV